LKRLLPQNIDIMVIVCIVALVLIGLVMVYSATHANPKLAYLLQGDPFAMVKRQASAAIIGVVLILLLHWGDYRISDQVSNGLYGLNLLFLILVLLFGSEVHGAKSWLLGFQPSEIAKILVILTLGKYLSERESLQSYYDLLLPAVFLGIPLALVLAQPDLGTALVFIFFFFIMLYVAGAPGRKLLIVIGCGVLLFVLPFVLHHFHPSIPVPLKDYQIRRLTSFINPDLDPEGAGWNVRQAITAVGSGEFFGKGLFHGVQGRLGYLPESHTDFIYSILCEELGFVGGFGILLLFFLLIRRAFTIAYQAGDRNGNIVGAGIAAMWFFHVLENVGMNIGIMPITGIPLPFISYGGTAMAVNLAAAGLLLNISTGRQRIRF
jgi:rod shape determining protein RodA